MIDVSDCDPKDLVKAAYALSKPQGLGVLHARPGDLDDETVEEILARHKPGGRIVATMDYVHGRSCKFTIYRAESGKLTIDDPWYDHSPEQLEELLRRCRQNAVVTPQQQDAVEIINLATITAGRCVTPETTLDDLGMDSLELIELVMKIEEQCDVIIALEGPKAWTLESTIAEITADLQTLIDAKPVHNGGDRS